MSPRKFAISFLRKDGEWELTRHVVIGFSAKNAVRNFKKRFRDLMPILLTLRAQELGE
jgi:hypothetical protein